MIGNDIIDLPFSRTESNWQRKGWLQKIFSAEELLFIAEATDQEQMVWLLWSMKESAYKIINRQTHITSYNPKAFQCSNIKYFGDIAEGIVRFKNAVIRSQSVISREFIHTTASIQNNCTDISVYIWNESECSAPPLPGTMVLKDEYGIPYLPGPLQSKRPVSKSHHGRFEAIVF